jgi:molecular chaperone GrpE (heat shock protein)
MKLVGECADLFDELDSHLEGLDPAGREIAEHVCLRLQEILQRCGVELIDQEGTFERTLHQPVGPSLGLGTEAVRARVISPGFRVGRRILRRARVQLHQGVSPTTTGGSP